MSFIRSAPDNSLMMKHRSKHTPAKALLWAVLLLLIPAVLPASHVLASSGEKDDYANGYTIVFAPDGLDRLPTSNELDTIVDLIQSRIKSLPFKNSNVSSNLATGKVQVQIKGASSPSDAMAVAQFINPMTGDPSVLAFVDPDGVTILDGSDVKDCTAKMVDNNAVVELILTSDGTVKFADATARLLNQVIQIKVDGLVVSSPKVNAQITGGDVYIYGEADSNSATALAKKIKASTIPFPMKTETITPIVISPQQGILATLGRVLVIVLLVVVVVLLIIGITLLVVFKGKKKRTPQ